VPELATRYVERSRDSIGNDLFAPGKKLRLIHDKDDQRLVQVWSVGPDGDWDGGRQIDSTKLPLDGDVGVEIRVGQSGWRWLADEPLRRSALDGKRLAHYLAARGPKLPKPPLKDDGLSWGPVVDGLQLAVELTPKKDAYFLGEAIDMRFHFRNAADYAIQVGLISCRQDMSIFVHDENGKLLKHGAVERSGTVGTRQQTLKPGETASYPSSGLAFVASGKQPGAGGPGHWVEAVPGTYTVRIVQRFPIGFSSDPREWQGELETGPVTVRVEAQPESVSGSAAKSPWGEAIVYAAAKDFERTGREVRVPSSPVEIEILPSTPEPKTPDSPVPANPPVEPAAEQAKPVDFADAAKKLTDAVGSNA